MACKMKDTKFVARCALRDDLTRVLEKCTEADVVIMGSPIYFSYPTGEFRSFPERFLFPVDTYLLEAAGDWSSKRIKLFEGVKPCDIVYTMNCPEFLAGKVGYPQLMEPNRAEVARLYGHCEGQQRDKRSKFADEFRRECPAILSSSCECSSILVQLLRQPRWSDRNRAKCPA